MYKTLIKTLSPTRTIENEEVIELWDVEPFEAGSNEPKWKWKINSSKLETPIIQPTHFDWQIRWRKGNEDIKKSTVKDFSLSEIEFDGILILRDLLDIQR